MKITPRNKSKKKYLKSIRTISEYNSYLEDIKITSEERKIIDMVFLNGYSYLQIGDELGYSESTIKHKMRKILNII